MGRIFVIELEGGSYRCKYCKTDLALASDCASRAFHCRRGKAYLFNNAVNVCVGPSEERMMLSCLLTVADTFYCHCGQIEIAHETAQKYKRRSMSSKSKLGRIIEEVDFSTEFDFDPEDA